MLLAAWQHHSDSGQRADEWRQRRTLGSGILRLEARSSFKQVGEGRVRALQLVRRDLGDGETGLGDGGKSLAAGPHERALADQVCYWMKEKMRLNTWVVA